MSLLVHMIDSGQFTGKKILAVDRAEKGRNDRTWCFWEKEPGKFAHIVFRQWKQLLFHDGGLDGNATVLDIHPYVYKMIRGIDFYAHCLKQITARGNIDIRYGQVDSISSGAIVLDGETIRAGWVFSSIAPPASPQPGRFRLLQHFLGREIETTEPVFTPDTATLMDFRVSQTPGTAFVYVMPFSATRALVEYTVFSAGLLHKTEYETALSGYISRYVTGKPYTIGETEYGIIPMTNERAPAGEKGLTYIGTAGGQTKPSSGYTFSFIQRQSAGIVADIITTGEPQPQKISRRYLFYDSVLLNVLATGKKPGEAVFSTLFRRNQATDILAFLGNGSDWKTDLKILGSLPLLPFTRAGLAELWTLWR